MVTLLSQASHTDAVVAALEATGLPVGRGVRTDSEGNALVPPCFVVHPIAGGDRYGTVDDWTVNADLVYQVTCVGETQEAAELVRDQSEVLLNGLAVPDRLIDVVRVDFGSDNVRRDDDIGQPKLFWSCMPRYRLYSTAA